MTQGQQPARDDSTGTEISTGKTKVFGLDYNIAAMLVYIPFYIGIIASIIWLNTEPKENRALRFHSTQSLILCISGFILSAASTILHMIPLVGLLAGVVIGVVCVVMLVFDVIALINTLQGKIYRIPIVADFADKYNPA